ncbi:MAG: rRNA pseudouridine synthase [Bacteroidaceae bacterium]|nr:rRNA pseudouridine synthase [Bacteroidaceae bacterium]
MADYEDFEKKDSYSETGSDSENTYKSSDNERGDRPYRSNDGYRSYGNRQGGYRQQGGGYRQGYGNNYRSGGYGQGGYRPRYSSEGYNDQQSNDNQHDGERRQGAYGRGGYGDRPYRPRFNNYNNRGEGYRPRFNNNGEEGGYRPRFNNNGGEEGGYRPRFNRAGGYQQGGYNRGGYRQGGYNRGGGYNNRYNPKRRTAFAENVADPDAPLRLNKFLANAGVCSRRDADKYIQAGVVKVNGQVVTELGSKVLRTDEVHFHDQLIKPELKIYVLLNKPKGYVTTSEDPNNRKTVMDLVKGACPERIYPVGRLDRNTTGVLLLTNDGEMASKLTHPKYLKKKIYHVWLDKNLKQEDAQRIADGVMLDDGEIKADDIQYVNQADRKQVGVEIHSGRNRIVRRMFEALGYHVIKLDRVFFAGLTKKNLKRGAWRFLTENEVNFLRMGSFE